MRSLRPPFGANVSGLKIYAGRFPSNGAASPAAWTQGGKGMSVPARTGAGAFKVVLTDPPGGTLVGWNLESRTDAAANYMNMIPLTWNSTTNTFTWNTTTVTTPQTPADPPAAATDREFSIVLFFSNTANT